MRSELNEGHSKHKEGKRKGQLKRIIDRVKGNTHYGKEIA